MWQKLKLLSLYKKIDYDLQLAKNEKLIKLPSDNNMMSESLKKFLSMYQKEKFKRFKVFDFRVKNQLIIK